VALEDRAFFGEGTDVSLTGRCDTLEPFRITTSGEGEVSTTAAG
jgi:hypothetical protein